MEIRITEDIFRSFPGLAVGVLHIRGLDNTGALPASFYEALASLCRSIRNTCRGEEMASLPAIACWREAYRTFGGKPKENKSSVESLCRTVLSGRDIRPINKLVDLYNFISLKHLLPAGGEDVDAISGDIELCFAGEEESPLLLLGDREPRAPKPGEVIYKDAISAICRRWNWREAERTKLTESTRKCILVLEALPPVSNSALEVALAELSELVVTHCKGKATSAVLSAAAGAARLRFPEAS